MTALEKVTLKRGEEPVLLVSLAHPDDETFGTGGTIALYARRGVKVYLVCATRGEVGEMDPALMRGFQTIAERREAELRCAAEKLGLTEVFFLGYRDSGMPGSPDNSHPDAQVAHPVEEVAGKVAHYIRQVRPQVVITFDPIGGYRHPDHIHIHQATNRAVQLAAAADFTDAQGLPPFQASKLYYQTIPRTFLKVAVRVIRLLRGDPRHWGKNHDIDLQSIAEVSFPTHARINHRPVAVIRDEAAECHSSQGGKTMTKGLQGWLSRFFRGSETFMRALPLPRNGEPVETDLFANL